MADSFSIDPARAAVRLMGELHLRNGLPEIFMGVMLLFFAASNWLVVWAPSSRIGHVVMSGIFLGFILAFIVFNLTSNSIMKWIRGRFLIQYRGYVKTSRIRVRKRRPVWVHAGTLIACGLTAFALVRLGHSSVGGWFLVILGALFCAAYLYFRPLRFKIYGILGLAAGLLLAFRGIPLNTGLAIFFTFLGSLSRISGLIVFLLFMQKAKVEAPA